MIWAPGEEVALSVYMLQLLKATCSRAISVAPSADDDLAND